MKDKYINDLKQIKDMMNRSSRFMSLSGLSGISAGVIALAGTYSAYQLVFKDQGYLQYSSVNLPEENLGQLLLIALATLVLAVGTVIYFTTRETRKRNQKIWDHQTKRILINLAIPLVAGGLLCLSLLLRGYVGMIIPLTLIFYGLALINASKYTLDLIRTLGLLEVALGLVAIQFIDLGLLFWAVGFGVLHIIFGLLIQSKREL